jgi:hypothetical protein
MPVSAAQGPAQGDPDSTDPLIAQVQDLLRSKIPPNLRVPVQKIVMAGIKIMYAPQTHFLMIHTIKTNADPAEAAGMGVTQLITILYKESKGTMPIDAIPLAAVLLVCDALDFMEKSGVCKVTPDILSRATQTVIAYLMQKVGMTPQKMVQMMKNGQGGQQSPPGTQPAAPGTVAPPPGGGNGLIGAAQAAGPAQGAPAPQPPAAPSQAPTPQGGAGGNSQPMDDSQFPS